MDTYTTVFYIATLIMFTIVAGAGLILSRQALNRIIDLLKFTQELMDTIIKLQVQLYEANEEINQLRADKGE